MKTTIAGTSLYEATAGRVRRLRRWLGLPADPPPRRPAARRLPPIRRSWLAAMLQARSAVLARVSLEEYLRARLARYLVRLPIPRSRLPLQIEVAGGEILSRRWTAPTPEPAGAAAEAWTSALVSLEGPSVLRELPELERRMAALDLERSAARHRLEELSRRLEEDLAAGRIASVPPLEHSAEELGRPPARSAAPQLGLTLLALAAVLAQAWSIAVPTLETAGHDLTALDGSLRAGNLEALFTCIFALGVSVGLLALALVGLSSAEAFARAVGSAQRRRAQVAGLLGGATIAAAAAAAATLPAPRSGLPPPGHAVLLLSVSAGAALLLRRAQRWRSERTAELAAALAWDRERARVLGERARRTEELAWANGLVRELDRRRDRTRRRLDELTQRSAAAARVVVAAQERERASRDRLALSLVAALERDRYEFVRQASARGATDLISEWKAPPEPRATVAEELPPPQSGRMAG